jgi:Sec-independent protein translocase protein TatA
MGSDVLLVLIVILIVVIIWRGPKTLPKIGEALGRGVREAKVEAANVQNEIQTRTSETPTTPDASDDKPA